MLKWLYHKVSYQNGEHIDKRWFGGAIRATMTRTMFNPGTWFVYFGKFLRVTINKESTGLALKLRTGFVYYHFLWWHGQIGWSFPWRKYAVGKP